MPIVRDRDELSSAADLSGKLKEALADSETLIILCSPEAARSKWVNEEIRHFRSLGRGDRIYCVIVDGDPQALDEDIDAIVSIACLAFLGSPAPSSASPRL